MTLNDVKSVMKKALLPLDIIEVLGLYDPESLVEALEDTIRDNLEEVIDNLKIDGVIDDD